MKQQYRKEINYESNSIVMNAGGLPPLALLGLGFFGIVNRPRSGGQSNYGLTEIIQNFNDNWLMPLSVMFIIMGIVFVINMKRYQPRSGYSVSDREEPESHEIPEKKSWYGETAEIEHTPEQMKGIRERHNLSSKTIASYSMDTMLALKYPVFNDVTEDATSNMMKANQYANDMYNLAKAKPTTENIKNYSEAVTDLENKLQLAKENAEQVKWDKLDVTLKKYFKKAQGLYHHAFDEGNPDELRINYLNELKNVIESINKHSRRNTIPKDIVISIEKRSQLEITG